MKSAHKNGHELSELRRYGAGIVLVAFSVCVLAQQPTIRKHREIVDDGNAGIVAAEAAMEKNDLAGAEQKLLEVTKDHPDNYRAWFDLGYIYRATDRKTAAIDAYRQSVKLNAEVFESNLNLGLMLAQAGEPEAETFLRVATKLKPTGNEQDNYRRVWAALAQLLAQAKPSEAIEAFRKVAEYDAKSAQPHLEIAKLQERTNDLAGAAAEFQKAEDLDPKSTEALAGLVNAYSKMNKWPEAEKALRGYIDLNPQNPTAHIQLGRLLAAQQKFDVALPELAKGVELSPDDSAAQYELAKLYLQQKQFDKALPYLQRAAQKDLQNPALQLDYGRALMGAKQFPQALEAFIRVVKAKPDFGEAYGDLAFAASENKNYPLTLQALDARAKFLPDIPVTYFLRASTLDHLRDYKNASEYYRKFLQVANGSLPDQEFQARHRLIAIDPKK